MIRILAVADEVDQALYGSRLNELRPDLILGCGDLPFDYLEYLPAKAEVPLLYVHGNHDPSPRRQVESAYLPAEYPQQSPSSVLGCVNPEDRWKDEVGLRIASLGGSIRYNDGDNQFTQAEMRRRVRRPTRRARIRQWWDRRSVDIVIAHSPLLDCGDERDGPHRGFAAFHRLIEQLAIAQSRGMGRIRW